MHEDQAHEALAARVSACFGDRGLLKDPAHREAVTTTIALLDRGVLRVASPGKAGGPWTVHAWVKQAILLYFAVQELHTIELGPFEFYDKIALKRDWAAAGVRVVPPATARYGSFIEAGAVLMPSYVNIGAWVGGGTMVDTWATVGSCAQIGRHVHLSGAWASAECWSRRARRRSSSRTAAFWGHERSSSRGCTSSGRSCSAPT